MVSFHTIPISFPLLGVPENPTVSIIRWLGSSTSMGEYHIYQSIYGNRISNLIKWGEKYCDLQKSWGLHI